MPRGAHGLKFGVYLSPWDRNNPHYGTPALHRNLPPATYRTADAIRPDLRGLARRRQRRRRLLRRRAREAHHRQAHLLRLAEDLGTGALPAAPGRDLQRRRPRRSLGGQRARHRRRPLLGAYDPVGADGGPASPGDVRERESPTGTRHGSHWLPAECDVSIRPGWFWHESENARVKTPAQLIDLYYKSVGRGANLLLNVPPNRQGLLQEEDVASLRDLRELPAGNVRRRSRGRAPR